MPPNRNYSGNAERAADDFIVSIPRQAREHHLDYLLVTAVDFYRERRAGLLLRAAGQNRELSLAFSEPDATVYRVADRSMAVAAQ